MKGIAAVLDNCASTIEGLAPRTRPDRAFRHLKTPSAGTDMQDSNHLRAFVIELTGDRERVGPIPQSHSQPRENQQTVNVAICYPVSQDIHQLQKLIAEDCDDLADRLEDTTRYAYATTGLINRTVGPYELTEPEAEGGALIVSFSLTLHYQTDPA